LWRYHDKLLSLRMPTLTTSVLQQVKDYYLRYARPTGDMARAITQKIVTQQGVKDHPKPDDYLAAKMDEQKERHFGNRGRFVSQDA
jgi:hypothetical protein